METTEERAKNDANGVEQKYASVADVAVFFSISTRTVWRLVDEGVLNIIRPRPRCPRINLHEAESVLIERGLGRAS